MAKNGKKKIIASAFLLFLKHGYKSVGLRDIMEASQLSKGAIYHHFASKYDIYLATLQEYFFKILATDFPNDEDQSISERLRNRYQHYVNLIDFVEHQGEGGIPFPIRAFYIFQLESENDEAIREKVKLGMKNNAIKIAQVIEDAITKGEIVSRMSADMIAEQIMAIVEGISIRNSSLERECKTFLLKQYDEHISAYLNMILVDHSSHSNLEYSIASK